MVERIDRLSRDTSLIATGLRWLSGIDTLIVNDWNLAHLVLRDDSNFSKTPLEALYIGKLLTLPEDLHNHGSAFAHERTTEDWQQARRLTDSVLRLASVDKPTKEAHRGDIQSAIEAFFANTFNHQQLSSLELDATEWAQRFANEYMMALLFRDPQALDKEKSHKLLSLLGRAQIEVFFLYLLSQRGTALSAILSPGMQFIFQLLERDFNKVQNQMMEIVTETLKSHPGSYFNQAVGGVSDEVKFGQALTLMVAGGETMGGSIAFGLRELAVNFELAEAFFTEQLSTKEFVTRILNTFPPADVFRKSPAEEIEVDGVIIPAKAILRMNPDQLHTDYAGRYNQTAPLSDSMTFGQGSRICAGKPNAAATEVAFFDQLKQYVQKVEYIGDPRKKNAVKPALSRLPADNRLRLHLQKKKGF